MTTPNDPYNSANQRPFDDEEILDPIAENPENPVPPAAPAPEINVPKEGVETDNAPDFGEIPTTSETIAGTPNESDTTDGWQQNNDAWLATPERGNEPHYSASEFASEQPREQFASEEPRTQFTSEEPRAQFADPDMPRASEPHMTPAEANSNPNPTLAGYFAGNEAAPEAAALNSENAPQRTSVMEIPEEEEKPTFATASPHWGTEPAQVIEIPEEPRGRGWLHVGSFFLTLLLVPVAWYLLSDAGARLYLVDNSPWEAQSFSFFPFLELLGGLVVIAIIWLTARATSLGAHFWGGLLTLVGLVALGMPGYSQKLIDIVDKQIGDYNAFTGNVIHHFNLDLGTGRIAIFGFMLLMTGFAAHSARRRGQAEATARTQREFLLKERSNSATS